MDSQRFRAMMMKVLDCIKEKRARKVLADLAALSALPPDDLIWAETAWFPECLKSGLKTTAVVMPKSLSAHMSLDKMTERIDVKLVTRKFFSDLQTAREWLIKQ